jgi:rhodanese-related sulfurtransferase
VPYAEVEPTVVKARLARGEEVFLLDVREPDEVAAWAYPIGVNIPMGELSQRLDEIPKDVTVVVAWNAENLTGGAVAWVAVPDDDRGPRGGS